MPTLDELLKKHHKLYFFYGKSGRTLMIPKKTVQQYLGPKEEIGVILTDKQKRIVVEAYLKEEQDG